MAAVLRYACFHAAAAAQSIGCMLLLLLLLPVRAPKVQHHMHATARQAPSNHQAAAAVRSCMKHLRQNTSHSACPPCKFFLASFFAQPVSNMKRTCMTLQVRQLHDSQSTTSGLCWLLQLAWSDRKGATISHSCRGQRIPTFVLASMYASVIFTPSKTDPLNGCMSRKA